jgi:thiamine phosphate synthase YjbQ (UPF0047 family)
MKWYQKTYILPAFSKGFRLITDLIINEFPELSKIEIGIFYIFIKHTSVSLTINENANSMVRSDFESHMNMMVHENAPYYTHV